MFESKVDFAFSQARNGSLLVYFSGHGLTHNRELYLAFGATDKQRLVATAFPAYKFLDLVAQYHIANFILVLDCCFASAAADSTGLALDQVAPTLELLHRRDEVAFTILAASGRDEEALATNKQSVFTQKFIDCELPGAEQRSCRSFRFVRYCDLAKLSSIINESTSIASQFLTPDLFFSCPIQPT